MQSLSIAYVNKTMIKNPKTVSDGIRQLGRLIPDSEIKRLKIKGSWVAALREFWKATDKETASGKVIDFLNHYAPTGTQWGPDPVNGKNFGFFRELSKQEASARALAQHNQAYWDNQAWRLVTFKEGEIQAIIDKLRARNAVFNKEGMTEQAEGILYAAQLLDNMIKGDIEPEPDYEEVIGERKDQEICSN